MKNGLVHIYTGDGKGKTTAALGLAVRAHGSGLKVLFSQFFKDDTAEKESLKKLGITHLQYTDNHPFFKQYTEKELAEQKKKCSAWLKFILKRAKDFDVLVIDEFGPAVNSGLIKKDLAFELIKKKPKKLELVLTGRGFSKELIDLADYVSEIKSIKHPFKKGLIARKGIEY